MSQFEFDSETGHRIRIWLDDAPSVALLSNEAKCEARILCGGARATVRSRVAIEVFQPFGASFHYGLLGCDYQADEGNELEVKIPLETPFPDRQYANSLARSLDVVTVGGLPEYEAAILTGIEQVPVDDRPSGVLDLRYMAHGAIGSAPVVFSSLGHALLLALFSADQPSSLEEAMQIANISEF